MTTEKHAIVAGGAGFIGRAIAHRLLDDGWRVTVWDDLSSGSRAALPRRERLRFRVHDVATPLPDAPRADVIFHLASPAVPGDYERDPMAALGANGFGTQNLIDRASSDGARLLFASTSEIYGKTAPRDTGQAEDGLSVLPPSEAARHCYPAAKAYGEALIMAAVRQRGLDGRIARLFNVYGPGMDSSPGQRSTRVIPAFVRAARAGEPLVVFGSGHQVRSFCWIDDAVEALLRLALGAGLAGSVINIGNPEAIEIGALARLVSARCGAAPIVHGELDVHEPPWRMPDIRRAREQLDWTPTADLSTGLERLIAADPDVAVEPGTTVVVPTYGRPERLKRLTAALERLEPPPAAVCVVDDGTPDGAPDWLRRWAASEHAFTARLVERERNGGPAAARNTGVATAQTTYVAFTDDDCEPAPDWILRLQSRLEEEPRDVAGVGGRIVARGRDLISRYYETMRILEPPEDRSYLVTANALYRTDLVRAVGGFDERIRRPGGEDPGLSFALADEGFRFVFEPGAVVTHDFRRGVRDLIRTFYRYGQGCSHVESVRASRR